MITLINSWAADRYSKNLVPQVNAKGMVMLDEDFTSLFDVERPVLFLQGGEDVNPEMYGERNLHSGAPNLYRDAFEKKLWETAVSLDVPVFAICRGHQLLNVLNGGTLYQDIGYQHTGRHSQNHRLDYTDISHTSGFYEMMLTSPFTPAFSVIPGGWANSYHHQGIKDLAPNGVALASFMNLIEAVIYPRALSVQWHPEYADHLEILHYVEHLFYGAGA